MTVVRIKAEGATPLPQAIKRKWEQEPPARSVTLEAWAKKLEDAAARRELLRRSRERGSFRSASATAAAEEDTAGGGAGKCYEERLAAAEARKAAALAAAQAKAAERHARIHRTAEQARHRPGPAWGAGALNGEVSGQALRALQAAGAAAAGGLMPRAAAADRSPCPARPPARATQLRGRQAQLAARLGATLEAAEALREQHVAQTAAKTAAKGALVAARAREVAAEARVREEMEATRRRLALVCRLERAAGARREGLTAVVAGMPRNSGEAYLPRDAARRAQLRRSASCRALQRCWRAFARERRTTAALAAEFAATGVPALGAPADAAGAGGVPAPPPPSVSAQATPFGTPDPPASPTSMVGSGAHAPGTACPANTPEETTPLGSPTTATAAAAAAAAAAAPPRPPTPQQTLSAAKHGFDEFAAALSSPATLAAASALLQRLEGRVALLGLSAGDCQPLLRRLFPPRRASAARPAAPRRAHGAPARRPSAPPPSQQAAAAAAALDRYPPRIFLCAYMVLAHPEVVFNAAGERERGLAEATRAMLSAFSALLACLLPPAAAAGGGAAGGGAAGDAPPAPAREGSAASAFSAASGASSDASGAPASADDAPAFGDGGEGGGGGAGAGGLRPLLRTFDERWVAYLEQFVAWKSADAAGLEAELVRMAVELEASKCSKVAPDGSTRAIARLRSQADIQALVEALSRDVALIRERVARLTGPQGVARLDAALAAARAAAAQAWEEEAAAAAAGGGSGAATPRAGSSPAAAAGGALLPPGFLLRSPSGGGALPSPSSSPVRKAPRFSRAGWGSPPAPGAAGSPPCGAPAAAGAPPPPLAPRTPSLPLAPLGAAAPPLGGGAPGGGAAAAAAQQHEGVESRVETSNLALMWQLLYDPGWRLPSEDAELAWSDALGGTSVMDEPLPSGEEAAAAGAGTLAAAARRRVRRVAEQAYWDGVAERLADPERGEEAAAAVAGLLGELGAQLAEVLPAGSQVAQEIGVRLDPAELATALVPAGGPAAAAPALHALLDWAGGLLRALGAPAREGGAAAAAAALRAELGAARGAPARAGAGAARALRLLAAQLRLLRLDAANASLASLAAQLAGAGAIGYARGKLAEALSLPLPAPAGDASSAAAPAARGQEPGPEGPPLGERLPHARGWLAVAAGQLPAVEAALGLAAGALAAEPTAPAPAPAAAGGGARPGGLSAALRQSAAPAPALPPAGALRAGLRAAPGAPAAPAPARGALAAGPPPLVAPVAPRSWRGLVRVGLVQLVAGEGAVGRMAPPELLRLDAGRLHAAQNDYQGLLAGGPPLGAADVEGAKRRLGALLADPGMRLPDVAAEINALAGGEPSEAAESGVQEALRRMLTRGGGAMRALTAALSDALHALLLRGPAHPAGRAAAAAALARAGAGALSAELDALAAALAAVAAVGEAVGEPWYAALAAGLL
eukprot:scaffold8.g1730.t1